jgi:hypothetical protein
MSYGSGADQGPGGDEGSDAPGYGAGQPYSSHDDPSGTRIMPPPGYVPPAGGGWAPPPGPAGPPSYPPPAYGAYPQQPGGYSPSPPGYGPPPTYTGYPQGYGYSGGMAPRTDGTAIAALILSICSIFICPIVPAIVALALIPSSRRTINGSGGSVTGLGLLTAAKVISWIVIGIEVAVGLIFTIAVIASAGSSNNNDGMAAIALARLLVR